MFVRAFTILLGLLLQAAPFQAKVVGIADGDTITVLRDKQQIRIRLEGIDCPERGAEFSNRAKQFTSELLAGKVVEVRPKELDRYGRTVARVVLDGKDASEELVKAGLAWHYTDYSDDPELARLEREAENSGVGIWSLPNPIPPWEQKDIQGIIEAGGEVIYHGNVKSKVFHSPACRYYNCKSCTVEFRSRQEAERVGYRPCTVCKPRD